jgi:sec-independent protein translocase protein TatA
MPVTGEPYSDAPRMSGSMYMNPSKGAPMGNFGPTEILIVLVLIILLFGSSRLPGIARGTGKHLRKTKDSVGTFKEEFESGMREIDPVSPIKETMKNAEAGKATVPKDSKTE